MAVKGILTHRFYGTFTSRAMKFTVLVFGDRFVTGIRTSRKVQFLAPKHSMLHLNAYYGRSL